MTIELMSRILARAGVSQSKCQRGAFEQLHHALLHLPHVNNSHMLPNWVGDGRFVQLCILGNMQFAELQYYDICGEALMHICEEALLHICRGALLHMLGTTLSLHIVHPAR